MRRFARRISPGAVGYVIAGRELVRFTMSANGALRIGALPVGWTFELVHARAAGQTGWWVRGRAPEGAVIVVEPAAAAAPTGKP